MTSQHKGNLPNRYPKVLLVFLPTLVFLILPLISMPVSAQGSGVLLRVKAGMPDTLPADGGSTTILEVEVEEAPCWKGDLPSDVIFTVEAEVSQGRLVPPMSTTTSFPVELVYTAGLEPGPVTIQTTVSYCPEGAVSMMGVCSEQTAANIQCMAVLELSLEQPPPVEEPSGNQNGSEAGSSEDTDSSEEESSEGINLEDGEPQEEQVADLARDLEAFLGAATGEADPGRLAAGGGAVASLILIWVLLQRQQGVMEGSVMRAVRAWRQGTPATSGSRPATLPELEQRPGTLPEVDESVSPRESSHVLRPDREVHHRQRHAVSASREGMEAQVHRAGEDLAEGLQALRNTLDQSIQLKQKIENEVSPVVRESPAFRRASGLFETVVKKVEQVSHVDQAKQIVDEFNQHSRMHQQVDKELKGRVSQEGRQSIKVLQSSIRGATEAPLRVSDMAHDTIAASGEAALKPFSEEAAQSFRKAVEEEKQALQNVREEVVQLPTKASKVVTKGVFGEHYRDAQVNNPELEGIRGEGAFPKPERPDFGRGWRKAENAYKKVSEWLGGIFQ